MHASKYLTLQNKRALASAVIQQTMSTDTRPDHIREPAAAKSVFDTFRDDPRKFRRNASDQAVPRPFITLDLAHVSLGLPYDHVPDNSYLCPTILIPFAEIVRLIGAPTMRAGVPDHIRLRWQQYVTALLVKLDQEAKGANWKVRANTYVLKGCNSTRSEKKNIEYHSDDRDQLVDIIIDQFIQQSITVRMATTSNKNSTVDKGDCQVEIHCQPSHIDCCISSDVTLTLPAHRSSMSRMLRRSRKPTSSFNPQCWYWIMKYGCISSAVCDNSV